MEEMKDRLLEQLEQLIVLIIDEISMISSLKFLQQQKVMHVNIVTKVKTLLKYGEVFLLFSSFEMTTSLCQLIRMVP